MASGDSQAASRACWAVAKSLTVADMPAILTGGAPGIAGLRKVGAKFLCVGPGIIVGVDDRGLGRGHARNRNPEGRAGDVVEARHVEELDRFGISSMLATDAELEIRPRLASDPRRQAHEPAHPRLVDRFKRRAVDDLALHV